MKCTFLVAAALLGLAGTIHAEAGFISCPLRELAVQSETIVVAAPTDPAVPGRFKALRVLLGTALKEGDLFEIEFTSSIDLRTPGANAASDYKPVRVVEAVLFLGPKTADAPNPRFRLSPLEMRLRTADGCVYYVSEPFLSEGCFLESYHPGFSWDDLLGKAAADIAEVRHIRSLKAIADPHRRNEALLDWVERRQREFGGGLFMDGGEEPSHGWGSLEQDVFKWILESRVPVDCWAAVKLYAELNQGGNPSLPAASFGTRAGRALLRSLAVDENALAGDRTRAMELLGLPLTLWPARADGQPDVEPLDEGEQTALIDATAPLLKDTNPLMRSAAARALLEASAPQAEVYQSFRTQRAVPALVAAYRKQAPGRVRNDLAEAIGVVGGPKRWEGLSGNAHGVVALLDLVPRDQAEGVGLLAVRAANVEIADPKLLLERLDDKGGVLQKQEQSLDLLYDQPRYDALSERFAFSMAALTPGLWRATVKGVAGPDKASWVSEPRLLRLAPPLPPGQPNISPLASRIIVDP